MHTLTVTGFRVARVRAIFTFPRRFHQVLNESPFLFVDLFSPFTSSELKKEPRLLSVTLHNRSNGTHSTAVIPLSDVVMSCHLVPQFQEVPEAIWKKGPKVDLLDSAPTFYLNEFSSHLMYAYMRDWKNL